MAAAYSALRSVPNMVGSSVDTEHATPAATRSGSGCSARAATAPVRTLGDWANVEHHATVGEFAQQARIVDGANPVPDPVGAESIKSAADRHRTSDFTGVRNRAQAAV